MPVRLKYSATRSIDGLSKWPLLLAWLGIALFVVIVGTLLPEYLIAGTFPGWNWTGIMVISFTAFGCAGSVIRNGRKPSSQPVTRYTKK